jgi:ADP-ribose pyrophosphatase
MTSREQIYSDQWRSFYLDHIVLQTGEPTTYSWAICPPAVYVIPLTVEHDIVLVRQYRYPIDRWILEVPAGGQEDEDTEQTARRELAEEIGGTAARIQHLGTFVSMAAHMQHPCIYYLATGVTLGSPKHESTELMDVLKFPAEKALEMARSGGIDETQSAYGLLLAEPIIREIISREE